jgi:hypothetical protein
MLTHLTFKKIYPKVFVDNWSLKRLLYFARVLKTLISTYTLIYYYYPPIHKLDKAMRIRGA